MSAIASPRRLPAALVAVAALLATVLVAPPASAQVTPHVSEFHYDNASGDEGEFVEVTADDGTDLTGWTIHLYNGSSTQLNVYDTLSLDGLVVAGDGAAVGAVAIDAPGMQNGSPDGLALVDPSNAVVELLSYEGTFTPVEGPAAGMETTDVGVEESGDTPIGHSLQLIDGAWTGPRENSRGEINSDEDPGDPPVADGGLVITEYVEGSSLNKAVEVGNVTDGAIDLADWTLELYSNGNTTPNSTFDLQGSVAPGDAFVFADDGADFAADADQTTTSSLWNGNDALVLRQADAVIDSFGQVGNDADFAGDVTLRRLAGACEGDTDPTDEFVVSDGYEQFAQDTFDGLGTNDCVDDGGDPGDPGSDQAADLLLTEVVVTPTGGEFVEIHNAGSTTIDLSDVYVTDATFAGGDTYYYNIVTGSNAGGGGFADFHARFPDAASIAAGGYQTVAMDGSVFAGEYGVAADYELFGGSDAADMREATPGSIDGQGGLTNDGEVVVLYTWDGESDLVADIDYVVWGDKAEAVDKTGVAIDGVDADTDTSQYAADTAITDQDVLAGSGHPDGSSWQRDDLAEGAEVQSGGNGVVGSDETSENLSATWCEGETTPGAVSACDGDPDPDPAEVKIHEVQGTGTQSPLAGDVVTVQGIVTSLFEDDDTLDAFFLQEEDADADGDAATSEGVFVFCRGFCPVVAVGDRATVTGGVDEFFGMTQLEPSDAADITVDASGQPLPTAVDVDLPAAGSTVAAGTFEQYEGMVATFPDTLVVSEYFELARYGQIVLTESSRPYQFTHDNAPSVDGYAAFLEELATRRIILDDDNNDQNDSINGTADEATPFPSDEWKTGGLSLDPDEGEDVRGGDTITGMTGVLHWSFAGQRGTDAWRVRPIHGYDYSFERANPRPDAPAEVGGGLSVASFNVLNYFTSIDDGTNVCQAGCRGADSEAEFVRQQDKIVAAMAELDADIVGLVEIENNADAVGDLVAALNDELGAGTYAQVDTGEIGTDSIKVGFIYKPATVELVGDHTILDSSVDERFVDTKNRPVLAQSFRETATASVFTAAVNHLKSKGSDCADIGEDESIVDGQGNCSETRTDAAIAMADWLADDPTGSGDQDVMILGDLNAYRQEDAIVALEERGYTDLAEQFIGDEAYSFLFDGQLGYLDYVMTNESLTSQVTGLDQWHVNADEVALFDYNDDVRDATEQSFERETSVGDLYAPDAYRSSDHDPVLVGLDLESPHPMWDADTVYREGDRVVHDGKVWEAAWWTRDQEPGASVWGPWQEIAPPGPDGIAEWTPTRIYHEGDRVRHDGVVHEAQWWTRNQEPGDPHGPWLPV